MTVNNDLENVKPNVLFILCDQMRGHAMNCDGNSQVKTPNLDRLASQGIRFTNAIANCPVCTPNRGTLLTGRYPLSHRAVTNDLPLPVDEITIGNVFSDEAYNTGYIGKWHLDGVPRDKFTPPGERRQGFDDWAAWNCSHAYSNAKYFRNTPAPIEIEGYEPEHQTQLAIEFLEQNKDNPFFLFLSWGPPHAPYHVVPERYRNLYNPKQIEIRANCKDSNVDRRVIADYYAAVSALDEFVGRLMSVLDRLNLADNTLVVFTSDHGDMLFSQGHTKKERPWEESIRVPFIARYPGVIPENTTSDVLFSTVDVMPSILGLMNTEIPNAVEGCDLSNALLDKPCDEPDSAFLTIPVPVDQAIAVNIDQWRGIRTKRYTYSRWQNGDGWVLYDNQNDPYQLENLIDDSEYAGVRDELEGELQGWLKRTNDEFLPWQEHIKECGLVDLWNERERYMHPKNPRLV